MIRRSLIAAPVAAAVLISVPPSTRLPAHVVPPCCGRLTVKHNGKRIEVRLTKVINLPGIPGVKVTALKWTLTPSPWSHLPKPEAMITWVRKGSIVLETRTDPSNGNVSRGLPGGGCPDVTGPRRRRLGGDPSTLRAGSPARRSHTTRPQDPRRR
jgi:hypothetical protein